LAVIGQISGAPDAQQGATRRSIPYIRCCEVSHVSTFESRVSNSNGHLRTTRRDQVSTGHVRYSLVSYAESLSNSRSHRSNAHQTRAQRGLQNIRTPDSHHRTHPERPVLSARNPLLRSGHTERINREHPVSGAVRPVLNPSTTRQ